MCETHAERTQRLFLHATSNREARGALPEGIPLGSSLWGLLWGPSAVIEGNRGEVQLIGSA